MVNVACVQMVSSTCLEENVERALSLIESSQLDPDCELLAFPENFLNFGIRLTDSSYPELLPHIQTFQEIAKQRSMNIVLGSIPFPAKDSGGRHFSRCLLINSSGEIQSHYDKRHLFDVDVGDAHGSYRESDTYCPGDENIVESLSFRTKSAVGLGLTICYDLRFPDQYSALRRLGADIICVPSAFTAKTGEAHWEVLLRARAIETQCFILAPNQGGSHSNSRHTWGHSMIIDPWGRVLKQCEMGESVCNARLDLSLLETIRKDMPLFS